MTPTQIRMARAALDLSAADLARQAMVAPEAIGALETGGGNPDAAAKLRATFEASGVEFLGDDGVRHRPVAAPGGGAIAVDSLNSANDE